MMFVARLSFICLLLAIAFGGAAHATDRAETPSLSYKIVFVAGDSSLPVFDNAVTRLRVLLGTRSQSGDVQSLSALRAMVGRNGVRLATLDHVVAAIANMHPISGQKCLVFATSHGGEHEGLWLSASEAFLTPQALDAALVKGCGDAPTVLVVSSCFSGSFAESPVARPNRVVLTAARADRTSFGCRAGRIYTVYDECLLDAFTAARTWKRLFNATKACVRLEEERDGSVPSEPQAWFGGAVADMQLR